MKEQPIATEVVRDFVIEIYRDRDPLHPRQDWDVSSTFYATHKRYKLADKDAPVINDAGSWEEVDKILESEHGAKVMLPVYMYDHSGICFNTTGFGDRWDSGRVGAIYMTMAQISSEYPGWKRLTAGRVKAIKTRLVHEIQTLSAYHEGMFCGFMIKRGDEEVESVWGIESKEAAMDDARSSVPA